MSGSFTRRPVIRSVAAACVIFAAATLGAGLVRTPGIQSVMVVVEFAAAATASISALLSAGRCADRRRRRAWLWLSAGFAFWALGEAWWAVANNVFTHAVGVPSPADAGFLLMPPCVAVALLTHPMALTARRTQRLRLVLDALTITLALLLMLWTLPTAGTPHLADGGAREIITFAYPVSDLLLSVLVCTLLAYQAGGPGVRMLWALGALVVMMFADFFFWALDRGQPSTAVTIADPLWVVAFVLWTVAAFRERAEEERPAAGAAPPYSTLPYVLLSGSLLVVAARWFSGEPIDTPTVIMLAGVVILVFVRQQVLLRDNRRLLGQVDQGREQLRRTRVQDPLTGLPNLAGFGQLAERAMASAPDRPFSVVRIRPLHTETLEQVSSGEADTIAAQLADRIRGCVDPGGLLGRVSEVTFAVLVAGGEDAAVGCAQKVLLAADPSVATPHHPLVAGIATVAPGEPERSAETLLQRSSIALSGATAPGGICVLTPEMLREHADRFRLQESVVRALRDDPAGSVEPYFEPVVELAGGRLAGVAARPAWKERAHGTVTAGRLLRIAAETGLTGRIDETVIGGAIARFGAWNRRWPGACGELWITVCTETLISGLDGTGLPERLRVLLADAGLPPSVLVLELLEGFGGRARREAAREALQRLRADGVRIAAGDAMAMISGQGGPGRDADVTADYFDISPLVVERCVDDLRARRVIQATVEFAADHDAATAARQVSTIEQHEELMRSGCALARGPLYGDSRSGDAMAALLTEVADGSWRTPADDLAQRHRSSWAWQELRQVVSGLPIAAFACDVDGDVILAEGALLDQLGAAGALDRPLVSLFPADGDAGDEEPGHEEPRDPSPAGVPGPDPAERPLADVLADALNGLPAVTTLPVRGRWLQLHLTPGHAPDGVVTGALGVVIDVTHRVLAERALRRSEQRFKTMFEQAPVGMLIVTPGGRVERANDAFTQMLGEPPGSLDGKKITELWHKDTPQDSWEQFDAARSGLITGYRGERAYRHRDGSVVWTRVAGALLSTGDTPGTTIVVIEDMRKLKQLEVELRHAQKLEAVGMLAAGIAHEINTPIQFVGDNLDFLSDAFGRLTHALTARQRLSRPVDQAAAAELADTLADLDLPWLMEEVPAAVQQSMEGVARVAGIVRAMRNFGHPDQPVPSAIDVNAAVQDTTTVARNEYKYVADLELDLGDVPVIPGFPSQFHQVILNLVVNAAHAIAEVVDGTERRGVIRIRTWADEHGVRVSVADNGCGMSVETRARVFDPFFTTKPVGQGTGQGLTIVRSVVVDVHHGTIDVQSTPGEGSVFTITLPRTGGAFDPLRGRPGTGAAVR